MTDQLKRAIGAAKTAQNQVQQTESVDPVSSRAGEPSFDMSESSYKTSHTAIRKARRFAMQGLYEWLVTDRRFELTGQLGWKANAPHDIAARTRASNAMHTVHISYYHEMMRHIPEHIEALDALIRHYLDRDIHKLDTVEHAILLIGAYELKNRLEIPYKVVLDEAMKLNTHFGATDAHKLINAVLDQMAGELRVIEVQADKKTNLRVSQKAARTPATAGSTDSLTIDPSAKPATDVDTPSASGKPRISANNTQVRRNQPNKNTVKSKNTKAATPQGMQDNMNKPSLLSTTFKEISATDSHGDTIDKRPSKPENNNESLATTVVKTNHKKDVTDGKDTQTSVSSAASDPAKSTIQD